MDSRVLSLRSQRASRLGVPWAKLDASGACALLLWRTARGPGGAASSPSGPAEHLHPGETLSLRLGGWQTPKAGPQAQGGRVRYSGRVCGGRGVVTLHQPEARRAFSRGSCPWIMGAWRWRAAPAPGRGAVESDLCSHTGFLVAAAAAPASHARLWGPR